MLQERWKRHWRTLKQQRKRSSRSVCVFRLANFQPPSEHSHSVMHAHMHVLLLMHGRWHSHSCFILTCWISIYLCTYRAIRREMITTRRWTWRPPRSKGAVTKRLRRRRPRLLLPRPRRAWRRGSGRRTRTSWTSPAWTTRPPRESLPSTTERRAWWATNRRSPAAREWRTQHKSSYAGPM